LGCVYIPPEFSPYSSDEAFLQLEDELITHSNFSKNIALIGDFNSRTSVGSDFVIPEIKHFYFYPRYHLIFLPIVQIQNQIE
jgi:hypothetical protein